MDALELELLNKYAEKDEELKHLWDDHRLYEKQLEKLESKSFLTPDEEIRVKELKKQKLDGKTKLVEKLDHYKKINA